MTTFKHGDRVTCEIKGIKITDARISIDKDGTPYICQNIKNGGIADDKLGYKYSWVLSKDFIDYDVTNLKLAGPKQLEDIEVGDVIVDRYGDEHPILMRSGCVVVYGLEKRYGHSASGAFTIDELKNENGGFTVKQEETKPEPVKMTVAEVAEKLGHEVEIVK